MFSSDDRLYVDLGSLDEIGMNVFYHLKAYLNTVVGCESGFASSFVISSFSCVDQNYSYSVTIDFFGSVWSNIDVLDVVNLDVMLISLIGNLYLEQLDSTFSSYEIHRSNLVGNTLFLDFSLIL